MLSVLCFIDFAYPFGMFKPLFQLEKVKVIPFNCQNGNQSIPYGASKHIYRTQPQKSMQNSVLTCDSHKIRWDYIANLLMGYIPSVRKRRPNKYKLTIKNVHIYFNCLSLISCFDDMLASKVAEVISAYINNNSL